MRRQDIYETLHKTVEKLALPVDEDDFNLGHETPRPSPVILKTAMDAMREILFYGYFGTVFVRPETVHYHLGVRLEQLYRILSEQILYGICFDRQGKCTAPTECAEDLALLFIHKIPEIKRLLYMDVKAIYEGDPAAKSYGEVIYCYPAVKALINYRMARELYLLDIPVLPRIITEMAHSETGIDIHPGARIGDSFSMDHGTGIVIGETCTIGNHVRLYQGVTLGAKRFELDESGMPKNVPRHPVLEDHVTVYANATILGRVTIGKGSVVGGNVWLTRSIPPGSYIAGSREQPE